MNCSAKERFASACQFDLYGSSSHRLFFFRILYVIYVLKTLECLSFCFIYFAIKDCNIKYKYTIACFSSNMELLPSKQQQVTNGTFFYISTCKNRCRRNMTLITSGNFYCFHNWKKRTIKPVFQCWIRFFSAFTATCFNTNITPNKIVSLITVQKVMKCLISFQPIKVLREKSSRRSFFSSSR